MEGRRTAVDADVTSSRVLFGVSAVSSTIRFAPELTSMEMYDQPNSNPVDRGGPGAPTLAESWRRCCDRLRAELGDDIFNSWFGRIALESVSSGQARLSVPTRFLKSWIDTHYARAYRSRADRRSRPDGADQRFRALFDAPRAAGQPGGERSARLPPGRRRAPCASLIDRAGGPPVVGRRERSSRRRPATPWSARRSIAG